MTEQEIALSRSTPSARFDAPAATAPAAPTMPSTLDEAAVREVDAVINDAAHPVVMFALEWCEFCWSVRRMLAHYDIPYRSIDLDSVAYQKNGFGGSIREALRARTGWNTLPQIFIGGEFLGGCTDIFDHCRNGRLLPELQALGIAVDTVVDVDPYSFLPVWQHPRPQAVRMKPA